MPADGNCDPENNACAVDTFCPATGPGEVACKACGAEIISGQGCNCVANVQIDNCQTCLAGDCKTCISGHFLTAAKVCAECDANCAECSTTATTCTSCLPGFKLDEGVCKAELPEGKCTGTENNCLIDTFCPVVDPAKTAEKVCQPCSIPIISGQGCNCVKGVSSPNCQTCAAGKCSACGDGYFLNASKLCSVCSSPCLTCSTNATTCTDCVPGYELKADKCEKIVPAGKCNIESNMCEANTFCPATTKTEVACKACGAEIISGQGCNCVANVQIDNCQTCLAGDCKTCISGHFLTAAKVCAECDANCAECSTTATTCTSCLPGFKLDEGVCKAELPEGKCTGTENNCLIDTFCPVVDPAKTAEKVCQPCSIPIISGQGCNCVKGVSSPNCQTCAAGKCSACGDGYFLNASKLCSVCSSPCLTCSTNATTCTDCVPGYELKADKCEKIVPAGKCNIEQNMCEANTFCPATTKTEVACKACGAEIISGQGCNCVANVQIDNCQTCLAGDCKTCISGHFLTAAKVCAECDANCAECSTTATTCTSCLPGFKLDEGVCKAELPEGKCTGTENNCLIDTFCPVVDPAKTAEKVCQPCSIPIISGQGCNCVKGVSSPNCQTCAAGKCSACGDGYFLIASKLCSVCSSPCLTCSTNATTCTDCVPGYELKADKCEKIVPAGKCNIESNMCEANTFCPATTKTEVACKACGAEIISGQGCNCVANVQIDNCQTCLAGDCKTCISGHFLTAAKVCAECDANCAECSTTATTCTSCLPGFKLDEGVCKAELPEGKCTGTENNCLIDTFCPVVDPAKTAEKVCQPCSIPIISGQGCNCVKGVSSPNCQTCAAGKCSACGDGYFLNASKLCSVCSSPCLTCSTNATTCTDCVPGYELKADKCEKIVPAGKCNIESNMCEANTFCPATTKTEVACKACGAEIISGQGCNCVANVQIDNCQTCLAGDCKTCISGHFLTAAKVCAECDANCAECSTTATTCTSCLPGFKLDEGVCKAELPEGKCTGTENNCLIDTFCPVVDPAKTAEKVCQPCSIPIISGQGCNCVKGVSSPNCQTCAAGKCSACGDGYFLNASKLCSVCSSPCLTCSTNATTCTDCVPGYELKADKCEKIVPAGKCNIEQNMCEANTFCPATTKTEVSCKACGSDIKVGQGCNCVTNAMNINCQKCSSKVCSECISGYFVDSDKNCSVCQEPCKECKSSATYCTSCISGYEIVGKNCNKIVPAGNCTDISNKCEKNTFCPATSKTQVSCKSCGSDIKTGQGCNCEANVMTVNCKNCGSNGCSECISQYYVNSSKKCSSCASPCLDCTENSSTCTSCVNGYELIGRNCSKIIPTGRCTKSSNKCRADTFCPATSSNEVDCEPCSESIIEDQGCNCKQNTSTINCLECEQESCSKCISGHFLTPANTCAACMDSCVNCTSADTCDTCLETYEFDGKNCAKMCETGANCLGETFCDPATHHCDACEGTCEKCKSKAICGVCAPGQYPNVAGICEATCTLQNGQFCKEGVASDCVPGLTSECKCGNAKNCASCIESGDLCDFCLPGFQKDGKNCIQCAKGYERFESLCVVGGNGKRAGLSLGAIVGIVVGVVVVVGVIGGGVGYYFVKKNKAAAVVSVEAAVAE